MYRHILISTDGSELAEHAVTNGLSLAKSLGAKVTVIIVEELPTALTSAQRKRTTDARAIGAGQGRLNIFMRYCATN
jgi:nucleotide-binding universal stress UspA family protein